MRDVGSVFDWLDHRNTGFSHLCRTHLLILGAATGHNAVQLDACGADWPFDPFLVDGCANDAHFFRRNVLRDLGFSAWLAFAFRAVPRFMEADQARDRSLINRPKLVTLSCE